MTGRSRAAFRSAVDWFHDQLEEEIADHVGDCSHPECGETCVRPDTAAEYWYDRRGYHPNTVEEWRLGWAPPEGGLFSHLRDRGFTEEEIRSTGLFTDPEGGTPSALWRGRYVFPYFDAEGEPVYAIARTTGGKGGGAAGYDGHPEDFLGGKYAKVAHTREYVPFEEPIFGLNTLSEGEDVVIAEGIADAITAAAAGHAVLSPVTTQFKQQHFDELLSAIDSHGVGRVYVIPDSERAVFSEIDSADIPEEPDHIYEAVNIPKASPGIAGALRTAAYLVEQGVDARVVELPRSGLRKVDLDDYLHDGWADDLETVQAAALPPVRHPAYEKATETQDRASSGSQATETVQRADAPSSGRDGPLTYEGASALWALDITDVNADLQPGYRGKNPLGHTGDSETYFVVYEKGNGDCIGKDYKRPGKPRYTGCTYILVDLGERDVSAPEGPLSPEETWNAWAEARRRGLIGEDDVIPTKALRHVAEEHGLYDFDAADDPGDSLPVAAHNRALGWVNSAWAVGEEAIDTENDEEATARSYQKADSDAPIYSWDDVRYIYEKSKEHGRKAAENLLRSRYEFMTVEGKDSLQVYNPQTGTFSAKLGPIRAEIHTGLEAHWSTHELNEILEGLKQQNVVEPRHLNGRSAFDDPHICVENGVLNLFKQELKDHSPDYYFTDRVPVTYDPDADTEPYEEFLDDITERPEDALAMLEMVGHALVPDAYERGYKKFLILTGDSDNGKSVFFSRIVDLLEGPDREEDNVMSVKLSKLASNRFSMNSVYGNMANIAGEIDGKKIRNTASLKDMTGGDTVEIEPKGSASFKDTINATMMFAANDPPIIGERDKSAIATRIVPIELPYTFVDDPAAPMEKQRRPESDLEEELCTPEALSGFLNLALAGLERLEENGDVSLPETTEERLKRYERTADPMKEFAAECLTNEAGQYVAKADVTAIYKEYAVDNGYETGSNIHSVLHGVLQGSQELNYTTSRPEPADYSGVSLPLRPWSERKRVLDRVTLTETGLKYAEKAGLFREEQETDEGDETDRAILSLDIGTLHDITATFVSVSDGDYSDEAQGWLEGPKGTRARFKIPGGNENVAEGLKGETVRLEHVPLATDEDGFREFEIDDAVTVTRLDGNQGSLDDTGGGGEPQAAADGGEPEEEAERPEEPDDTDDAGEGVEHARRAVVKKLRREKRPMTRMKLANAIDEPPTVVEDAIDKALRQGDVQHPADKNDQWVEAT